MSGAEATIAGVHLDGSPEEFAGRWESVFSGDGLLQGRIVRGVVAEHLDDGIKVGLPGDTIGVIANDDLENGAIKPKLAVGDEIDVYVTGELNNKMPIAISYAKAQDKRWVGCNRGEIRFSH